MQIFHQKLLLEQQENGDGLCVKMPVTTGPGEPCAFRTDQRLVFLAAGAACLV